MTVPLIEPGSYRDRDGRIVYVGEQVYRLLSARALADWEALRSTRFFGRAVEAGKVVPTETVPQPPAELIDVSTGWAGIVRHRRIPYVSYPYEWTFGMLRRAALLQLELLEMALDEGFIVKDASAFNVQWRGALPVFIDVPSFQRRKKGEPWIGYLQFCQLFLYPLMLTAYRDLPFRAWLRGHLDGVSPAECADLLSLRDLLRPGVLLDVSLHSRLQRAASDSGVSVRRKVRRSGFTSAMMKRNVQRLRRVVQKLEWRQARSTWSEYATEHGYDDVDLEAKRKFVSRALTCRRWSLVWDLGANTGAYSKLAAEVAEYVVAMDADELAAERLYRDLHRAAATNVLPLVQDLADPSPAQGWRWQERHTTVARGKPDLVLCLALVHHLVLGRNLLLDELIAWLGGLCTHLVVEWVDKSDPMARRLLLNKDDDFADYTRDNFERCMGQHFLLLDRCELGSGTRALFLARTRS